MSELDEPCAWTEEDPEACWYCTGEACKTCDDAGVRLGTGGYVCEHDTLDRHGGSGAP